jgi:hypothetical protein
MCRTKTLHLGRIEVPDVPRTEDVGLPTAVYKTASNLSTAGGGECFVDQGVDVFLVGILNT